MIGEVLHLNNPDRVIEKETPEEKIYEMMYQVHAQVIDMQDKAIVASVKEWAVASGLDTIILMDEKTLLEVLKLGTLEYMKQHPDE